ncbi:MAG: polyphosphate kinase, partial [Caulobacter sp.]|nr:polyphosphate kinase [Caulobacter sp.]
TQWYFQRFVPHLPAAGDCVLFNRSWSNRGGVEPVMGFCTAQQHEAFLVAAPDFEALLVGEGIRIVKLWLDIGKEQQARRLKERYIDPLKALKTSPLDAEAQKRWDDYSGARDLMLIRTHTAAAPWTCVKADHKKAARIAVMRHLLHTLAPARLRKGVAKPDPAVLFPFEAAALSDGRLER